MNNTNYLGNFENVMTKNRTLPARVRFFFFFFFFLCVVLCELKVSYGLEIELSSKVFTVVNTGR